MEASKMKCNKHNRNLHYAIFRESNLNQILNVLPNQMRLFFFMNGKLFIKLKKFFLSIFVPIFYIFGRFFKMKYHTILRMALLQFFISCWPKVLKLIKFITQSRLLLLNSFLLLVLSTFSAFLKSLSDYFSVGLITSLFLTNFQC